MYTKDLQEDFRLRLSKDDMDFLRRVAAERGMTVSSLTRFIIGDYRRTYAFTSALTSALQTGGLSNGDIKTDKHNLV